MKRLTWLPILLLAGCTPQLASQSAPPAAVSHAPRSFPTVQAIVDAAVRDGRVPAISVAVGVGDEPATFISAGELTVGTGARATQDSLWRIYSMTKPVTGIAAMILVDEGKLTLDQPVSDFIPEFKNVRVLVDPDKSMDTRPAARPVTIRHLLTHTAGLNYAILGNTPAVQELARTGVVPYSFNRAQEAKMRPLRAKSLQDFARRAAQTGLVADPGTRFSYSMSLDVLAAVVEKASGMPFGTFLQRRLLTPLGMKSTYWQVPRSQVGRFATTYADSAMAPMLAPFGLAPGKGKFLPLDPADDSVYLDSPSFPYGGAGLVSTARDYDRFLHMLQNDGTLDGVRILRPETARLAKSDLLPGNLVLKDYGPVPRGEPTGFGAGGFVTTLDTDGYGRKRGTFGWDGAAGTRAWTDTAQRVRVTTMINIMGAPGLTTEIDKAIMADLTAAKH